MSSSNSRSSNATSTTDQRSTNTINAGIGGDIDESLVNSGNYGDTSLVNHVDESSESFEFDYTSEYLYESDDDFEDNSDNSFKLDLDDNSNHSVDNSVQNITDGGAFSIVDNIGGKLIESLGENQIEVLGAANRLVEKSLDASAGMANRSLDGALAIKSGQTISGPVNQTVQLLAKSGVAIAALSALVYGASKTIGGKA